MVIYWFIFLGVIIALIVYLVIIGIPNGTTEVSRNIPCTEGITNLPQVDDPVRFEPCYNLDSQISNQAYYDKINDWTVLPLDSKTAPPATQVCLQYCTQTQLPGECVTQTKEFTECMEKLSPEIVKCTDPSRPAARLGTRLYYAVGKGKVSCYEQQ